MASKRKTAREDRSAIISPYWTPNGGGWRHPGWWLAPVMVVSCFIYGFFYAATTPYMIVVCIAPLAVLAGIVIWALPDARTAPTKPIAPLTYIFLIALIMWPVYLGVQFPGTPWITMVRLIETPLLLCFFVSLSTSAQFRSEVWRPVRHTWAISVLVLAFSAVEFLTVPMAGHSGGAALQTAVVDSINWTFMYFVGCWVFMKPGRIERYAATLWAMGAVVAFLGIWEDHVQHLLWEGHIPSFLTIDSGVRYELAVERSSTGLYRAKTTFTTPLGMSQFLALTVPFILQFIAGRYRWFIKVMAVASLPPILLAIIYTDSRLGLVGSLLGLLGFGLVWGLRQWFGRRTRLVGPTVVLGYPMLSVCVLAASFIFKRLHDSIWGGYAQKASTEARIAQWKKGLPMVLKDPIGHGPGQAGTTLQFIGHYIGGPGGAPLYTVDSYYLVLLLQYGIAGLLVFLTLFIVAIAYAGFLTLGLAGREGDDRDWPFLVSLGDCLGVFFVIKAVFAETDTHSMIFLMLAMIVALRYRAHLAGLDRPAEPAKA